MAIILGLGFTGQRLARRLLRRGEPVFAPVRGVERFRDLAHAGAVLSELRLDLPRPAGLPKNSVFVDLVPPLPPEENARLHAFIGRLEPKRIVYVSSTGVYGDHVEVNEETQASPNDERGRLRLDEERWVGRGSWTSLILRAAAIYGPGRGVHVAMRQGKMPRGSGSGIVSRIHVEDLAAMVEAGIFSGLEGDWPVGDEEPCASAEIMQWCARLWQLEETGPATGKPTAGRRVDGARIRELLGITLNYPSWKTGIPASLQEEKASERPAEQRVR